MKKLLLACCLGLTWPLTAPAQQTQDVTIQAHGYGDTYEQAVESALGDAVRQVTGARVATRSAGPKATLNIKESGESQVTTGYSGLATEGKLQSPGKGKAETTSGSARVETEGASRTTVEAGMSSENRVTSQGKVKGYKVLKQSCENKGCEVDLEVTVEKTEFQSKAPQAKRDSIAIVTTGRLRKTANADQLRQSLTDKLVKSGRFTVLDRSNDAALDQEMGRIDSAQASDEQRSKLGQLLGADFMLIVNLTQAGVSTKVTEEYIDLTGETNREVSSSTRASVRYTLVESATRAVRWSDSSQFSSSGNRLSAALDGFLDKITNDIAEIVSPPKVIGLNNGQVIINRGKGLAETGQTYAIFSVGEALIDPDTGEQLGATEEKVATIRIATVQAKLAYGDILSGNADAIARGSIARLQAAPPKPKPAKKASARKKAAEPDQQVQDSGGIILN
ncbi:CsgG/HfaB family protein [Castellaniella sp.]|uniref:CsgG/HfaB family protein n=1 Tax=Castellaniella sp. TaxID=1955812 RepID=UPI002B0018DF|nr:CsgG/HfaB family protein [Castellaniella sp.]